jgi:hypothetical protein
MASEAAAAAVTGARHLRTARNGQDAAVAWVGGPRIPPDGMQSSCRGSERGAGLVVVCDGCSSGASSEVGAHLGATLFARSLSARLLAGARVSDATTWSAVRADVVRALAELVERMPGDREAAIHDHLLFTIVAAAVADGEAAVWALGDGAYWLGGSHGDLPCGGRGDLRVLGPFADNAPPYLAYDLLGEAGEAHFAIAPRDCSSIIVATDGALDLLDARDVDGSLARFAEPRYLAHPDALRRQLTVLARAHERIDWDERRVVRTPAPLQDDCAIGVLRWRLA